MPKIEKYVVRYDDTPATWLGRAWDAVRSYTLGPLTLKDRELSRKLGWGGGPTAAGVTVNDTTARECAPFINAVSLISGDASTLPLHVYKRTRTGGKERQSDHRIGDLIHTSPNSEMTAASWRESWFLSALVFGTAYSEIVRDRSGRPAEIWPLLSHQVSPYRDDRGALRYRVTGASGETQEFTPSDLLILKGLSFDGVTGLDTVQMMRETLALSLASQRFAATFFGNGSTFGGVLRHPGVLKQQGQDTLRHSIESLHRGPDRAHRFLILEEGVEYQKVGVDPDHAQMIETRRFQIAEVARYFKIPVGLLGDIERSTFHNQEQQSLLYVTSCLRGWLVKAEQEMASKLLTRAERAAYFIEHELSGLLRGDTAGRAAFYDVMVGKIGAMSRQEVRRLENLPDIPGFDEALQSLPNTSTPNTENAA